MVHSLPHRSKHRKMLLIIVCEAEGSLMSELIGRIDAAQCWELSEQLGEFYC